MNGGTWMVARQTVQITGETEISDNPAVGDTVRVRAERYADGRLVGVRIEKR